MTPTVPTKPKFNWASFFTNLFKGLAVAATVAEPIIIEAANKDRTPESIFVAVNQGLANASSTVTALQGVSTPTT